MTWPLVFTGVSTQIAYQHSTVVQNFETPWRPVLDLPLIARAPLGRPVLPIWREEVRQQCLRLLNQVLSASRGLQIDGAFPNVATGHPRSSQCLETHALPSLQCQFQDFRVGLDLWSNLPRGSYRQIFKASTNIAQGPNLSIVVWVFHFLHFLQDTDMQWPKKNWIQIFGKNVQAKEILT